MIQSYKDRGNSTLQVFLDSNTLTLLNYSFLDSSLNIKLESNSKESQAIQEKEKAQREQQKQDSIQQDSQAKEYKNKESKAKESKNKDSLALVSNDRDSQTQDSSLTASNDKSQSTSMLPPILEDNEIKCPHNEVVQLKSNKGKTFLKQAYANNQEAQTNKDYGYGSFKLLDESKKHYKDEKILTQEIWLYPAQAQKIR